MENQENGVKFGAGELSERYDAALLFASSAHRKQRRKNGDVPYLSHLLRVSGLVLDYGASEDVAIAALLHDVVEDCGGLPTAEVVREKFGEFVANVVLETSDSTSVDASRKAPWRERKERYISRLRVCSDAAALISGCDKYDNVTALTRALTLGDTTIVNAFHAGRDAEFWYWDSVVEALTERRCPCVAELVRAVETLKNEWKV